MATLLNPSKTEAIDLTSGATLGPGRQGIGNPNADHEAALIDAGKLVVVDPDTPLPPAPPTPQFVVVDTSDATDSETIVRDHTQPTGWKASVAGAGGVRSIPFSQSGTASVGSSGTYRLPGDAALARASLRVGSAPEGSDLVVELLLNGEVVATLTIADGDTDEAVQDLGLDAEAGDLLAVNSTSIGSTTPAAGVVVQVDLI